MFQGAFAALTSIINRNVSNITILRMLLVSDPDAVFENSSHTSALITAESRGRIHIAMILLERGANPNDGFPPPIEMFQLLRHYGARHAHLRQADWPWG